MEASNLGFGCFLSIDPFNRRGVKLTYEGNEVRGWERYDKSRGTHMISLIKHRLLVGLKSNEFARGGVKGKFSLFYCWGVFRG